jgi:hypothetical protein
MWFFTAPTGLDFVDRSPFQLRFHEVVEADASRLFALVTGERMEEWFTDLRSLEWDGPPPYGVGSKRVVRLKTLSVKERFLAWEAPEGTKGGRLAFAMDAVSVPLVRRMMEDFRIESLGPGRSRFEWTVHYAPRLVLRLVHPVARLIFGKMFGDGARALREVAERDARDRRVTA